MTAGAGHDHQIPAPAAALPKAPPPRVEASIEGPPSPPAATGVLADRIAAALVHREPGWRLPRRTALARRYGVSLTEIDAALAELAGRSLVRRLADGQLYRASPADYWIPVEGVSGLSTRLDPMGSAITCQARHVSRREAPLDVAGALGVPAGEPIRVIRCTWSAEGQPVAVSTAYLPEGTAGAAASPAGPQADPGTDSDLSFESLLSGQLAAAVSLEMSPPQPAIARSLRLSPGRPVITVTVRFDGPEPDAAALTVVMLKPELFRVAIETAGTPAAAPS
jgi:DNA-binding GntR family transcriptional regulator